MLVNTPISFQRTVEVPESSLLAGLAIAGAGLLFLRHKKQVGVLVKSENSEQL
ncbi:MULTISPECIES: PEP-CTERM sorting domain-containing protein [unclassified Tolypothrix]|uniref:PEP-CTERM sorting domain-containing protein n=1 Tax=unclassified Tolypothrix TaxID=2649714 RepID=UPI0005EAB91C|nr:MULTISPECIES: PEP-CTERM sorting domain-containing protein [unclassified Tolypothrix]EKF05386.1 PEP-CTERM putative exosortase interaction domain protein [Tolypothrix sp. PCC 7601]MBE9088139.1 PEP-CTERM sorting domain-containing protein [Tolypothrix sp. LEGE 11397]UYD25568.1 PEP-CTERM sorting domain-containing protein [Tolypothrix sp. PCC 7712]UYD32189.1 PEP-CTERM sorting domain-containing protein [Tolypothrix sp. PCC 7601]